MMRRGLLFLALTIAACRPSDDTGVSGSSPAVVGTIPLTPAEVAMLRQAGAGSAAGVTDRSEMPDGEPVGGEQAAKPDSAAAAHAAAATPAASPDASEGTPPDGAPEGSSHPPSREAGKGTLEALITPLGAKSARAGRRTDEAGTGADSSLAPEDRDTAKRAPARGDAASAAPARGDVASAATARGDRVSGAPLSGATPGRSEPPRSGAAEASSCPLPLSETKIAELWRLAASSPRYGEARRCLAAHFQQTGDIGAERRALNDLVTARTSSRYDPTVLLELSVLEHNAGHADLALRWAGEAERYQSRLTGPEAYRQVALIQEVKAKAFQKRFNDQRNAIDLERALGCWRQYESIAREGQDRELEARAAERIQDLERLQRHESLQGRVP
jgi:hypothetical protein